MPVQVTINYKRIAETPEDKTIILLEGSTRSGKTIAICQFLLEKCLEEPGTRVRCFRKDGSTHRDTTILDLKFVMRQFSEVMNVNLWKDAGRFNKTEKTYEFTNGSVFSFHETKDIDELHGMQQDYTWLNEVMEISEDAWGQIGPRTRIRTFMDWNPSYNHHWVFSTVRPRPDAAYYHSTYLHNPTLTDAQVREIEKWNPDIEENRIQGTADSWRWTVYGEGKRGKVEGAIYKLWEETEFWPERFMCRRHGYGMDFGFFPDPATLIECCIYNDGLYLREIFYEQNLLVTKNITRPGTPSIQHRLEEMKVSKESKIYADCAQPGSIQDLALCGYNIVPCTKGPDSIKHGIRLLKKYKFYVHYQSVNLKNELEMYKNKRKPDGTWIDEPEDKNNHLLDPLRYWAMAEIPREVIPERRRVPAGKAVVRPRRY